MDGWRASLQRRRLRVLCVICCWWNGGWLTPSGAVKQRQARRRGWGESTPLFFIAPASHHANIGQTHQRCVITANTAKYLTTQTATRDLSYDKESTSILQKE